VLVLFKDSILQVILPYDLVRAIMPDQDFSLQHVFHAVWASFSMYRLANAARLASLHAPPPVYRSVNKLTQDPTVTVFAGEE
jgi:hypothetical protein